MVAINEALQVISYFELPDDEQPPELIWGNDRLMAEHWQRVDEVRKAKYGGKKEEAVEEVPLMDNELAREMGV